MKAFNPIWISLAALLSGSAFAADPAAATLRLDDYLDQVRTQNPAYRAANQSSQGALLRQNEADIPLAFTLFGSAQALEDESKSPLFPGLQDHTQRTLQAGIRKTTTFGLSGDVSYTYGFEHYIPLAPGLYYGRATIELTQSLLQNGFGAAISADRERIEAQNLAQHFQDSFTSKAALAEAEAAYWRLALAREAVDVSKDAVERAQKIYDWNARRARLQLAEQSDLLQSKANLEQTKLQLQTARDTERTSSQSFNVARYNTTDDVPEKLEPLENERIDSLQPPERKGMRDDVKAAEQAAKASAAGARAQASRDLPQLDVYGSYSTNSRLLPEASEASYESVRLNNPTKSVGVRFSVPLDFGTVSDARKGLKLQETAADLNYQKTVFDVEKQWSDLSQRFLEAKQRLLLARSIEDAQQKKLENERGRLNRGRTTTYQVLLFEQDYRQSQLTRIQAQADVLQILAQMKLFGERS
jgi:outer membrane protein TolC